MHLRKIQREHKQEDDEDVDLSKMQLLGADNPQSAVKRSFLNECIRQIYIITGRLNILPDLPSPIEYSKSQIWAMVNYSLRPALNSDNRAAITRVKRQLFREPRRQTRKARVPKKRVLFQCQSIHFKGMRSTIGLRKVRRSYLDEAHLNIMKEFGVYLKNQQLSNPEGLFKIPLMKTNKQFHKASQDLMRFNHQHHRQNQQYTIAERRRWKKCQQQILDQQYEQRLQANEKILQDSIRALYYMKTLLGLIVDQEERLYV